MSDSFTLTTYVPASPLQVYTAWLDGEQHSEMTGGRAHCEPVVGAAFDAWDGYIRGTNLELEPGRRILQSWRSSEFPDDAPDSRVELTLTPDADGTTILLRHWDIPPGQGGNYEKGWHEHYFSPMRQFFEKQTNTQVISADRPAPAAADWERPAGEEDVDDWSSESSEDSGEVGWEAPVIEEVDEPTPAPEEEKPQPITLQAERPFLDAPQPRAEKPAPKPKKAAREKPAAKKAASKTKPAKKTTKKANKKKPAKKAAKATSKKPAKKKTAKKKPAKKKPAKKAVKKKPAKKGAKKTAKKAAKKAAKKKPAKKKAAAKKKPARKAAKKKAGKKPARKKR